MLIKTLLILPFPPKMSTLTKSPIKTMRITQAAQEETRLKILNAARKLFGAGFSEVTTRAIAQAAGIATGTLFNYFPSKEALGFALVNEAVGKAQAEFDQAQLPRLLDEILFAHVATQLRAMGSMRIWTPTVFESALSPLRDDKDDAASEFRRQHLARVQNWIDAELGPGEDRSIDLHLYWSLYLGVVSFWANDESQNQAATLALLDRSMRLFSRTLKEENQ